MDKPELSEPHIKGAVIRPSREWIISTFGRPLYERAVKSLAPEHAAVLEGEILSVGWYPLAAWSAFRNAVRREAKAEFGIDGSDLDRRDVFEAGPQTLTKVYRLVFGLMSPVTIINKLLPVVQRVYSHGEAVIVVNTEGYLVMRFQKLPRSMLDEVRRMFPLSAELMLHLVGQEVTELRPIVETEGLKSSLELRIKYRKQKK